MYVSSLKNFLHGLKVKVSGQKHPKMAIITPYQRLFLQKLKTFHFSSLKFSKNVAWPFWSYKKIALCLENIPDSYKVYLECLEKIFRRILKNYIFAKNLFLYAFGLFEPEKKLFGKNIIFQNASEIFF